MKLYYKPGACSLASHIILNELNLKYDFEEVDLAKKETASGKDFNQINPKGYVPALELDNGKVLTETVSVLNYLSDLQPAKNLTLQDSNGLDVYEVYEWLSFIGTELHKNFTPFIRGSKSEDWLAFSKDKLKQRLDFVDHHLNLNEYLAGDQFTIADAYLFVILGWVSRFVKDFDFAQQWPNLAQYRERLSQRDSVKKAMKAEGLI